MRTNRPGLGHLADPATLALTELVADVVRHVPGRRCSVLILREPDGLRVEVADAVPGGLVAKAADPLDERGRGLVLVEAVTDPVGGARRGPAGRRCGSRATRRARWAPVACTRQ
ncbi:ATP-binding protein [Streptomyces tanashiensis]|uniref:ATP-binding protein n=1 Tax=Streptomyces tanashiensis TaxID=67367 RepID=UPI0034106A54